MAGLLFDKSVKVFWRRGNALWDCDRRGDGNRRMFGSRSVVAVGRIGRQVGRLAPIGRVAFAGRLFIGNLLAVKGIDLPQDHPFGAESCALRNRTRRLAAPTGAGPGSKKTHKPLVEGH